MKGHVRRLAALLIVCSAAWACMGLQAGDEHDGTGTGGASADPAEFCDAMDHLIVVLEPGGPSSPNETKTTFEEAAHA